MGWTYNTADPDAETNAPTIAAVGIAFTAVSFLLVTLRMYVRGFMVKAVGSGKSWTQNSYFRVAFVDFRILDDWVIVFTWVWFHTFHPGFTTLEARSGINNLPVHVFGLRSRYHSSYVSGRFYFWLKRGLTKCRIKMGTRSSASGWYATAEHLQFWIGTRNLPLPIFTSLLTFW